jgi:hypothetical protein
MDAAGRRFGFKEKFGMRETGSGIRDAGCERYSSAIEGKTAAAI